DGLKEICADPRAPARLTRCPFLLFSLAEDDAPRWNRLFERTRMSRPDLVDAMADGPDTLAPVVLAALGFLWQLARRRPYAARVVSGASLAWCERLAEATLVDLFRFAVSEHDLVGFRNGADAAFWRRLLVSATSARKSVRRAARLAALQSLLTRMQAGSYQRLAAAACSLPAPARKVADTVLVSKPRARGYNTPPDDSAKDKKPHKNLRKR
ncbi:MAG: hypothetical protein R3288_14900, partial [Woeseiaceae bacterium]|nr:hypothetical protein [Woeseiaceae bacterium]